MHLTTATTAIAIMAVQSTQVVLLYRNIISSVQKLYIKHDLRTINGCKLANWKIKKTVCQLKKKYHMLNLDDGPRILTFSILTRNKLRKMRKIWRAREVHRMARPWGPSHGRPRVWFWYFWIYGKNLKMIWILSLWPK